MPKKVNSDIKWWWKIIHDYHRKSIPPIPKSLEELKFQIFHRRETIVTNNGEIFCYMDELSIPVTYLLVIYLCY